MPQSDPLSNQRAPATPGAVQFTRRIFADQLTPVLAYRRLVAPDDRDAPSFLFESVEQGGGVGRYSLIGVRPILEVVARGAALECVGAGLALGGLGAGSLRSHKGGRVNRPAIAGSAAVSVVLAARAGARWRGALVGGGQLAGGLCVLCSALGLLFVRCWIYQQAGGVKEGGKAR